MSTDFWVMTTILVIIFAVNTAAAFMVSASTGVLTVFVSAIYLGFVLWNQYCITSSAPGTSCSVLAWLYVVGAVASLLMMVVILAQMMDAVKQAKLAKQDEQTKQDEQAKQQQA